MNNFKKLQKPQMLMFIAGLLAFLIGAGTLSFFVIRKIYRDIQRDKLMRENIVVEIPALHIKAPVLEGTDNEILAKAAGHFIQTGSINNGNYCIAGHNSTIYAEIFNELDQIKIGDEMYLVDNDANRTKYLYIVTEYRTVEPNQTDVLNDFGDNRLTVISCTDDGTQQQVVVGILKE